MQVPRHGRRQRHAGLVLGRRRVPRCRRRRSRTAGGCSPRAPTCSTSAASPRARAPRRSTADEEIARVVPVVARARAARARGSRSTRRSSPSPRRRSRPGATYVNDVSAFRFDPELAGFVADARRRLLPDAHARRAAHDAGRPALRRRRRRRQGAPRGAHGVRDRARASREERIHVDPGIGFGKTIEHNLELLRRLDEIVRARPAGRRRHLAQVVPRPADRPRRRRAGARDDRDERPRARARGPVFRVHDVAAVRDALDGGRCYVARRDGRRRRRRRARRRSRTTPTTSTRRRASSRPSSPSRSAASRSTRTTG